jgi:hypothetical protein
MFTGTTVLNHTAHVYFWFMAGFIFLLPRLDSIVERGYLENNRYNDGSDSAPLHKIPIAAASDVVKSVSGANYSHH